MRNKKAKKVIDRTFGQRLKGIRNSLKQTQAEFAEKMEISVTNLSDIENGKTHPCHDFFLRILKKYNVNLNYCLSGEGAMFLDMEGEPGAGEGGESGKERYYCEIDHEDVRLFLDYFFSSKLVRYHLMEAFTRLLNEDEESINKERLRLEKEKTKNTPEEPKEEPK